MRRVEDIPWGTVDWDELLGRVDKVRERLVVAFGQTTPYLASIPRSDRLPDYFGHAYSVLAQECYDALATGNESLFVKIFPPLFDASLAAFDKLRSELADNDSETARIFMMEPLIDIVTLSGHAIIYTELVID